MKREEAQLILQAYRASGEDAYDPQFEEALALVRKDPELASWFVREQALDAAISAKNQSVPPPSNLTAQLLSARNVIRRRSWWRKPVSLAAAALVLLLICVVSVLLLRSSREAKFASFRNTMIDASLNTKKHLDVTGLDADELKQWLLKHRGDAQFVLPRELADKRIAGCKVLAWQGHWVTLLCLKFEGKHIDIFVVNESALPGVSRGGTPDFASQRGLTTATWRRDGKIYFVTGNVSESDLKQLL